MIEKTQHLTSSDVATKLRLYAKWANEQADNIESRISDNDSMPNIETIVAVGGLAGRVENLSQIITQQLHERNASIPT